MTSRGPAPSSGRFIKLRGSFSLAQAEQDVRVVGRQRELGLESQGYPGRGSVPRRWQQAVSGGGSTMELLRTITYQPAAGTKMCEQALGKACGGDSKKKRPQQPSEDGQPQAQVTPAAPHHHHHHSHSGPEISRIIVDPTTGKRYCRGKVLGKVSSGRCQAAGPEGGLPRQVQQTGTLS